MVKGNSLPNTVMTFLVNVVFDVLPSTSLNVNHKYDIQ